MAHNLNEGYFEHLTKHPKEAERFSQAMEFVTMNPAFSTEYFIQTYDFSSLPPGATFIDVGGSHGRVAIQVAQANPGMRCIVQDLSESTIATGKARLPEDLEGRVEFMVYDFWTEQPVKGADVYYFRWVFHDWSDTYAVKLLKNLVPALKRGSRVVINDVCLPPKGATTLYQERLTRYAFI